MTEDAEFEMQPELVAQRREFAAAYKQASEQLKAAQGTVRTKSLETALWGWRWGRVVNEIHGKPPGQGGRNSAKGGVQQPGTLTHEQSMAYCQELGVSTKILVNGQASGTSTIVKLRKVANRVATEEHLRELIGEYGNIWRVVESLRDSNSGLSAQLRDRANDQAYRKAHNGSARREIGYNPRLGESTRRPAPGYSKFVPPQSWVSYLVQQGLTRGEISAALCVSLEALGPEESFKLWDRANRPDRYSENARGASHA